METSRRPARVRRMWMVLVAVPVLGALGVPLAAAEDRFQGAEEPVRQTAQQALQYVALGDSSAAGPGIPNQIHTNCGRSDHNWPHVVATTLGATLNDVTCSAATTAHLTRAQYDDAGPQLEALTEDTDLVTLAIGANDIGLFFAFANCRNTPPAGPTCQQRFTVGGVDQFDAAIANTARSIRTALADIHRESPNAKVLVVGYLTYWSPGGCYQAAPPRPADPYRPADADYIQSTFDDLMKMLDREARQGQATYVDIRTPSAGNGLCEPAGERWLEGDVPDSPALPYHPNAAGMSNAAATIADQARRALQQS